jgi:probable F420-dependent oxidoreductase
MELGRIGIWLSRNRVDVAVAPEIEALGYGAIWVGGSPSVEQMRPWIEATERVPVASGILNIWQHDPADVAEGFAAVERDHPGRFLLGIGVGHPEATSDYTRPLSAMRTFFDGLDEGDAPVPRDRRVAAALGPRMLDLAAERSLGTHPYFTTPEHTRFARERLGAGPLVAPELAVVVEPDEAEGRRVAREYAARYLELSNYTSNLLRFGFGEDDIAGGGSDRLIDAVVPHGTPEHIAAAVREHLEAGADHVCVQPLGHGASPVGDLRALAERLLA